ncbi:hypothetical protein CCP3SC1AL1_70028 [Gammaproteobacteria bacterium]
MNTILPFYSTYRFNSYYITIINLIEKRSRVRSPLGFKG